jgi:polyhydroxyalkanoate synthesis regulator phasin
MESKPDHQTEREAGKRARVIKRLDRMVDSGRLTDEEADRIRAAREPGEFDRVARDISVRHAQARVSAAVADGSITKQDAAEFVERLKTGEHPRSLRAHLPGLRPRTGSPTDA